jgi:hypothetical protein
VAVSVSAPLVPVTVIVYWPAGVEPIVVTVSDTMALGMAGSGLGGVQTGRAVVT